MHKIVFIEMKLSGSVLDGSCCQVLLQFGLGWRFLISNRHSLEITFIISKITPVNVAMKRYSDVIFALVGISDASTQCHSAKPEMSIKVLALAVDR